MSAMQEFVDESAAASKKSLLEITLPVFRESLVREYERVLEELAEVGHDRSEETKVALRKVYDFVLSRKKEAETYVVEVCDGRP